MNLRRFVALALLIPFGAVGCAGADNEAQVAAARKLAADCKRNPSDPADEYITAAGKTVTLDLSDDVKKKLKAFAAQDVNSSSFDVDAFVTALAVNADSECLAEKAGTPTDADGSPKAGEWPNWTVTIDAYGVPTFTSTVKG